MTSRLKKLEARRTDALVLANATTAMDEAFRTIQESESVKYAVGAMQQVNPIYTRTTIAESDRVENQLRKGLSDDCEYRRQGSVTNGTDIKAKSDVDLLVITDKYVTLEPPQKATSPYRGNAIADLFSLREECVEVLSNAFPEAKTDDTGRTAIAIEGGSLKRKVDIVPSNWYNTSLYVTTGNETFRGIQVLNTDEKTRVTNTPFLHNARLEEWDQLTNGGAKKAARLMKSLKYDSDRDCPSSYDIVGIAYNLPQDTISVPHGADLIILESCVQYCQTLVNNPTLRARIKVPDGHREVFKAGHATEKQLLALTYELVTLRDQVIQENSRRFQKLTEARVFY